MVNWISPVDWLPQDGIVLDAETRVIVEANSNASIMAGPGAGKTELLAQKAAFLLQTNTCPQPKRILAISFKRDAAKNLKDRVEERLGSDLARRFESYTFDAFAKSLLDRFRDALPNWCKPTRDYRILFANWREWQDFAYRIDKPPEFKNETIAGSTLQDNHAYWGGEIIGLPIEKPTPTRLLGHAWLQWWNYNLGLARSNLTFQMIASLALTILTHNPAILRAIRQTYSHVFIDEFQDTTGPQYELVKFLFAGSQSIVTSVGDNKQLIMTFAGADAERILAFNRDFQSDVSPLVTNFRSNRRIVEIINSMATVIEPAAIQTTSARLAEELPEQTDGVLHFDDTEQQAKFLATSIAKDVNTEGGSLKQHDFMLLVRQYANDVEEQLRNNFSANGLKLRNEARIIQGVSIQDMMSEPLAELIIGVLQMASDDREDNPFLRVTNLIGAAFGIENDRPSNVHRIEKSLRNAVKDVVAVITTVNNPSIQFDFVELVELVIMALGEAKVRRLSLNYDEFDRFLEVKSAIAAYLTECAQYSESWKQVVDTFLGRDQVRLMTVHKSKGLEAHTVIFLNLQNNSFHERANMDEERLTFFVAASRARERLFVTTTSNTRNRVEPLFEMLRAANVQSLVLP